MASSEKNPKISIRSDCKSKYIISVNALSIRIYTHRLLKSSSHALSLICTMWLISLLLNSGDVHPNPGPADFDILSNHTSISSTSYDLYSFLNFPNHLSTVDYNVQSITFKIDILLTQFSQFDIISFTETWLSDNCPASDLSFPFFHAAERKDRVADRYGCVMVYVKDNISYVRRNDLEIAGLECIWIQIKLCNKRKILFGVFYRPPTSDSAYYSLIEDSVGLAIHSNISNIIITGDFNINQLNPTSNRKINTLCNQFNLFQLIEEPTHYTKNSSSLIALLFVTNKESVLTSGVGEPCLDNNIRYHCPIFGVFNFLKPKRTSVSRVIWKYNQDDYNTLKSYLNDINWNELKSNDINKYIENITSVIKEGINNTIPHKLVIIKLHEPAWINNLIKSKIRQRKRLYKKRKTQIVRITGQI